jgi:hypothetical protein
MGVILGLGEWRSLVAHLFWEQRVAGSNPVSPTIIRFQQGSCISNSFQKMAKMQDS